MKKWPLSRALSLLVAIVLPQLAGGLGSIFTATSIPTWYGMVAKPTFSPPNWIFGPVWTILFLLMGIASFLIWERIYAPGAKFALGVYLAQLILNIFWSFIFFGLHNIALALIEIVFLWILIAITLYLFYQIRKPAGYLLIPYLAWVTFAALLNFQLWRLN